MKYQKERCLQCDKLGRPTNLQSKYEELDATGKFTCTEYWFCSDKCYEEELSKYLDTEYLPKYWFDKGRTLPPNLNKALNDIARHYAETYAWCEPGDDFFNNKLEPMVRAEQKPLITVWKCDRDVAVNGARVELKERIEDEYLHRYFIEQKKFMEEQNKLDAAHEKQLAAIEEKHQRNEEKRKREEERLREKREREEESYGRRKQNALQKKPKKRSGGPARLV